MNEPLFISYHTPDDLYRAVAARLRASLEKFRLPHVIVECPSRGSWHENCFFKANFIYAMLRAYVPRPLVWLDADAEVCQPPELFKSLNCDIAAVINNQGLFNSVIYLKNTIEVEALVKTWIAANKDYPNERNADQPNMATVLSHLEFKHINFQELPWEYSYFPGVMGQIDNPVILQHMANREGRELYK